jgi:hypothetical protein
MLFIYVENVFADTSNFAWFSKYFDHYHHIKSVNCPPSWIIVDMQFALTFERTFLLSRFKLPSTQSCLLSDAIYNLLEFAVMHLVLYGRLVFWLPTHKTTYVIKAVVPYTFIVDFSSLFHGPRSAFTIGGGGLMLRRTKRYCP